MHTLSAVFCLLFFAQGEMHSLADAKAPELTTVASIRTLSRRAAAEKRPVRLRGVVTFYYAEANDLFLQDATGPIYLTPNRAYPIVAGSRVEVTGFTDGGYTNDVRVSDLRELSRGPLPPPPLIDYRMAARHESDCRYTTLEGIVRAATIQRMPRYSLLLMEVEVDGHIIQVPVTDYGKLQPTDLLDSTVRMTGTIGGIFNAREEIAGLKLNVTSARNLSVVHPAPVSYAAAPLVPLGDLVGSDQFLAPRHRIRTEGVVTLSDAGSQLVLKDGENTVLLRTMEVEWFPAGRSLQVTGFPSSIDGSPGLEQAQVLFEGPRVDVPPRDISFTEAMDGTYSGKLVALTGEIVSLTRAVGSDILFIRSGTQLFPAVFRQSRYHVGILPDFAPGTKLRVSGICFDHSEGFLSGTNDFELRLRSPADIQVLRQPSWWTMQHILYLSAMVLLVAVIALASVILMRQRVARRMAHLARHDPLTGLANRVLLAERLEAEIRHASRRGSSVAVFTLDLDHFKQINDSSGHAAGDEVLRETSRRLTSAVRQLDTVARLSGDEFIVILPGVTSSEEAASTAEKMLRQISRPHRYQQNTLTAACSLGISLFPQDSTDAKTLMRLADGALRNAKLSGRNCYRFSSAEDDRSAMHRIALEASLREALRLNQFVLFYQPKYDCGGTELRGFEALVRWQLPNGEQVQPSDFIPLAEETRLILPLGAFILEEACRQAQAWRAKGLPPVPVSVNIAAAQFADPLFAEQVISVLEQTGLPPMLLELEITETAMMADSHLTADTLARVKALGVLISVDDFGTGHSSLSYLKRFPIDVIKIDQSFIRDLETDSNDLAIVAAIIGMGRGLGLKIIAEGVETREQAGILERMGCDSLQGYLFSRPLPIFAVEALLSDVAALPA